MPQPWIGFGFSGRRCEHPGGLLSLMAGDPELAFAGGRFQSRRSRVADDPRIRRKRVDVNGPED